MKLQKLEKFTQSWVGHSSQIDKIDIHTYTTLSHALTQYIYMHVTSRLSLI